MMKNKLLILLLTLCLCVAVTACGEGKSAATANSTTTTTTTAEDTTTTAATADTTTTAPTGGTQAADANPFDGVSAAEIALYDTHLFQTEEAVLVKQVTDKAQAESVTRRLAAATWEHYPDESGWVKYQPLFAEWALVLTCTDGRQRVLHLFSAEAGWASLGTFDGGLTYADIIAQAKAHDKEGVEDFARYKMDSETLAYLLALFGE